MGYESERAAIEGRIAANWTTTPIKWPNVAFEPGAATAFIEPVIANAASFQASIGLPAIYRHPGVLSINIRVRPQIGTAVAKTYADTLAALFRSQVVGSIVFQAPAITLIGDVDGWYLVNMHVSFYRDEVF